MKVLVSKYQPNITRLDLKGFHYTLSDGSDIGNVSIYFDEKACIDPSSGFLEEFKALLDNFIHGVIRAKLTEQTCLRLESELNSLVQKYIAQEMLFTGAMYEMLSKREGWLLIGESLDDEIMSDNQIRF